MTQEITIPEGEHDRIHLFALDMPLAEALALRTRHGEAGTGLHRLLGADMLDPDKAEIFDTADLAGMGLPRYLNEGQGIPRAAIAPREAELEGLQGTLMVLPSSAFGGMGQTLRPGPGIRHVATLEERAAARPKVMTERADPADAAPQPAPPSEPAAPGRIGPGPGRLVLLAMLAIVLLAALLYGFA